MVKISARLNMYGLMQKGIPVQSVKQLKMKIIVHFN